MLRTAARFGDPPRALDGHPEHGIAHLHGASWLVEVVGRRAELELVRRQDGMKLGRGRPAQS